MWWWSARAMRERRRHWLAARMGVRVALLTTNLDTVGQMSCNPAIGGVAKGQIVREVDALGGVMGRAIDATGIQFRLLNRRKGPAMHSPRAQADKKAYQQEIKRLVEDQPNLSLRQEIVQDLATDPSSTGASHLRGPRGGRCVLSGCLRGADDRHLSSGGHAHRRVKNRRRPRGGGHHHGAQRRLAEAGVSHRAVQNGHASQDQRQDDRLLPCRNPARR